MSTTEEAIHVKDEIIQRGRQIYDEELKQPLEAEHKSRWRVYGSSPLQNRER